MSTVRLIRGDCLEVMKGLESGSVDAVVTDPPYGQTNEAYDGPIAFNSDLWRECSRIAKPNAALVSFAGSPTYHRIASAIEAGGWKVRQMWGWIYRDGMITSAWPKEGFDRTRPAFDPICYATRGKVLLNLEREGDAWDRFTGRDSTRESFHHIGLSTRNGRRNRRVAAGHYPTSLVATAEMPGFEYFMVARTRGGFGWVGEKTGHPSQKPLDLMEWIISKLPGPTILDTFMGSGSTGVTCIQAGRNFIGIESDPDYFAIAERRIEAARMPLLDAMS